MIAGVQEMISQKSEASNKFMMEEIQANDNLNDFQATVIESVQEMITTQINKSNKHMMAGVQEMISQKIEASNKFMMEEIQAAIQISIINQQQ